MSSDEMSQTFTVRSSLPLTIRFPSGLKLTLQTPAECVPFWVERDFLWVRRRRIRPRRVPQLVFFNPPKAG
jgi:hypothetical protein